MPFIKGFTTKKSILDQLKKAGVTDIKFPFTAKSELKVKKNPLKDFNVKDSRGGEQKITLN